MQNAPNRGFERTARPIERHFGGILSVRKMACASRMADPKRSWLSTRTHLPICAVQNETTGTAMLPFFIAFLRRERRFAWQPAVDLSDPYVAAALAPVTYS
jgi:hypothetical protein